MNLQQGTPGRSWALHSFIIAIGAASLLAGCQQPEAAMTPGQAPGTDVTSVARDCAAITAGADRVWFDYDSAELRSDARTTLDGLAAQMQRRPHCRFVIEGHCDERGTREYNLALGEKRASAVEGYLAALGVDAGRLQTVSYGKERPAATGSGEEVWSQNRRAVLVLK